MGVKKALTGGYAAATGAKLSRVQVIPAYPITPQTTVIEYLSEFVNNGELDAEYIRSEGEHGMMAESIGAAMTGARVFTSTCAIGLMYAMENVVRPAGLRLPIVMADINRPAGYPGGLHPDHSDALTARDWGWMQFFCETHQELLDSVIIAYKIGEDHRVLLPSMVCGEGYYLSYTTEMVDVPDQEEVDEFLPAYKPVGAIDPANPMSAPTYPPWFDPREITGFEWNHAVHYATDAAMRRAETVIKEVNDEFYKKFGRRYGNGMVEEYRLDDADVALVTMGCMSGNAKEAVDLLRNEGKKVGLVRLRTYRPFPTDDFRRIAEQLDAFVVLNRHVSRGGSAGPVAFDVKSALFHMKERPLVLDVITGLCGYEVTIDDMKFLGERGLETATKGVIEDEIMWYPKVTVEETDVVPLMSEEDKKIICHPGTATCQGCGMALAWRTILETLGRNTVVHSTSGCGGWSSTARGKLSFSIPRGGYGGLPGGAASTTGLYRGLKAQGKAEGVNVVLISGDGSFGDMGFMAASGAAERNEDIIMVVYDNEAYMNTGIQRSGSTPYKAWTTTTPVGSLVKGKEGKKKDLPAIMAAHHIPYVATASPAYMADFKKKLKKAASIRGCKYIHLLAPCPTGHRYDPSKAIQVVRLAVQTNMFPLYEVDEGEFRFTYQPKEVLPVGEYLRLQGRFRHLSDTDIEEIQKMTNEMMEVYEELVEAP